MTAKQIDNRRAIEALRSGVPNMDAVRVLGCEQSAIEEKLRANLQATRDGLADGKQPSGLLISGDFGAGKSHLLEYLQHIGLEQNFICSKVVISKETPLHDPVKFYRSAVEAAIVPEKRGLALTEVATKLEPSSRTYVELEKWAHNPDTKLNSRFAATLFLFKHIRRGCELWDQIISFWSGNPIGISYIRKEIKKCGEASTYKIEKITLRDLAIQRFRFTPRLVAAAGYSGWVLLVDEVELVGRYSPLQRAKSYAELARWMGKAPNEEFPGLVTMFAIMSNFESLILEGKNDTEILPRRLRDRGLEDIAKCAERGMRIIEREKIRLKGLDNAALKRTHEKVRAIHAQAYGWEPPEQPDSYRGSFTVMRQHVKRWINEWDLRRLDPEYTPVTEVMEVPIVYNEDSDLEAPSGQHSEDSLRLDAETDKKREG